MGSIEEYRMILVKTCYIVGAVAIIAGGIFNIGSVFKGRYASGRKISRLAYVILGAGLIGVGFYLKSS